MRRGAASLNAFAPPRRIGAVLSCAGWLLHSVLILYPEAGSRRQMFAVIGARIDLAVVVRWNAELARSRRKVGIARLASRSLERLFIVTLAKNEDL